ncbi:MAG TPA: 2-dehydropantoate 2-reductase [Bellilinea sp.]
MTDLKLLIFGAGAIGTYIGGSLLASGQKVVFFDRPESAAQIDANGLRLVIGEQSTRFENPEVKTTPEAALQAGPFDAALVAVKSFDTAALAQQFAHLKDQFPPILCMQNGVENESVLGAVFGVDNIIAGTLTSAIGKPAPGTAVLERLRGIGIAAGHPVSERLVDQFNHAGLNARLYSSASSMKWSKLLTNLLANASSAILDMPPAEIYTHPGLYAMEVRQIREALAVMKQLGAEVVDLPGTPVKALALLMQAFPAWVGRPLAVRFLGRGRGKKMPSFHIDLHAGLTRSEVSYLNGAVARFGEGLGVDTPVNRLLTDLLTQLAAGEIPLETFQKQPEKLLTLLK